MDGCRRPGRGHLVGIAVPRPSGARMKRKPRLVGCVPLVAALLAGPFASPALAAAGDAPDLAFGAYQRGRYRDAFSEATKRVEQDHDDAAAMALLGELNGGGLGVAP